MDIKVLRTFLFWLVPLALLSSCASPLAMHQSFTKNKASLRYIHDSDKDNDTSDYYVAIARPEVSYWQMRGTGMVRRTKASAIPLIVVNTWSTEYEYLLGKGGIRENVADFVQQSFIKESERSGIFRAGETANDNSLVLEIEIDSIGAGGSYKSQGHFFFMLIAWGYGASESAEPGHAFSRFHYRLRQGEKVLLEDFTFSEQKSKPLEVQHKSKDNLRQFYNANLVEALSATIKSNIEIIVEDIDSICMISSQRQLAMLTPKSEPLKRASHFSGSSGSDNL
jgi:hypothetical protein